MISFNIWATYFVWNFKGTLWFEIPPKICHPYIWEMCTSFIGENLRALSLKSWKAFLNLSAGDTIWHCRFGYWLICPDNQHQVNFWSSVDVSSIRRAVIHFNTFGVVVLLLSSRRFSLDNNLLEMTATFPRDQCVKMKPLQYIKCWLFLCGNSVPSNL